MHSVAMKKLSSTNESKVTNDEYCLIIRNHTIAKTITSFNDLGTFIINGKGFFWLLKLTNNIV